MRILIITIVILLSIQVKAQEIDDWQVGINFSPFFFTRINSKLPFDSDKQDLPNGIGFGLTIEKKWSAKWGIKTSFEFSKQNEKYFVPGHGEKLKSTFEYYKLPITMQYHYPLSNKLFLTVNQGIQFSYLKYYKTVISSDYEIRTYSSNYADMIFFLNPENNVVNPNFNGINHKDFLYGIIGSVGIKGYITDKISYSTNLRYEYDLNTADDLPYYSSTLGVRKQEGTTNNFRLGLELGIQYHFSLGGQRFDKSPHNL